MMLGSLGVRARIAILLVALSVGVIAIMTFVSGLAVDRTMDRFGRDDLVMTARQTAAVAGALYRRDGGWSRATLDDLRHIGATEGHLVVVRDERGRVLPGSPQHEPRQRAYAPVVIRGHPVGSITLAHLHGGFLRLASAGGKGQRALSNELHERLQRTYAVAGAVSASVAFVLALLLAAALARPVRGLTEMANKLEAGDIDGLIGSDVNGSPEHHQLASTLRRAGRALKREDAVRRETVTAVAHELRTPLVGIRGRIEAGQDGLITDFPKALEAMHRDVLRLVRLIEDLEQLTQAEKPGLLIARAPVDLAEIAAARAAAMEPHFAQAGITLECDLAPPVGVNGDPERLGQVIDNLLSNALRYTDAGGSVCLRVRSENRQAALEVEDTGIGISEDDLGRIFDRFWRGDKSRSRATGGAGIGLTLVQELVRGHDGEIEVASRPGEGTVFRITLPATTAVDAEPVLQFRSLTRYVTPSDSPLVVTSVDRDSWDGSVACVQEALRRRIRMGEPVIVLDVDDWPEASEAEAIEALTRVHGEARARGGTLVLLAESSDVLAQLARAGAHHMIPVVSSVGQLVEELKELGLSRAVAHAGRLAAADG